MRYLIYRIYYKHEGIVYVGRTTQTLVARMRQHMTKGDITKIDPTLVEKIEYADCVTEADMMVYEVYYINLLHPRLNEDAKSKDDELTFFLPPLLFYPFPLSYMVNTWKRKEEERKEEKRMNGWKESHYEKLMEEYRNDLEEGKLTNEEYTALCNQLFSMKGAICITQ